MTRHDRTGEPIEDRPACPYNCRNGWLTPHDSDAPRLCPNCREQPKHDVNDHAERPPSDRARAAIEKADRE
jgi:hypothetical protein